MPSYFVYTAQVEFPHK